MLSGRAFPTGGIASPRLLPSRIGQIRRVDVRRATCMNPSRSFRPYRYRDSVEGRLDIGVDLRLRGVRARDDCYDVVPTYPRAAGCTEHVRRARGRTAKPSGRCHQGDQSSRDQPGPARPTSRRGQPSPRSRQRCLERAHGARRAGNTVQQIGLTALDDQTAEGRQPFWYRVGARHGHNVDDSTSQHCEARTKSHEHDWGRLSHGGA